MYICRVASCAESESANWGIDSAFLTFLIFNLHLQYTISQSAKNSNMSGQGCKYVRSTPSVDVSGQESEYAGKSVNTSFLPIK